MQALVFLPALVELFCSLDASAVVQPMVELFGSFAPSILARLLIMVVLFMPVVVLSGCRLGPQVSSTAVIVLPAFEGLTAAWLLPEIEDLCLLRTR